MAEYWGLLSKELLSQRHYNFSQKQHKPVPQDLSQQRALHEQIGRAYSSSFTKSSTHTNQSSAPHDVSLLTSNQVQPDEKRSQATLTERVSMIAKLQDNT
jgi:hypothetical protein